MGIEHQRSRCVSSILRIAAVCVVAAAALAITGCGESGGSSGQQVQNGAPADTLVEYTVRGRVTQLPGGPAHPAREFMVHHEAIPEFRSSMAPDNKHTGMMSMTMAFPLGEGVDLDGIGVGEPIEMMFEATYDGETGRLRGYVVRRLTPLDPGTTLEITGEAPHQP